MIDTSICGLRIGRCNWKASVKLRFVLFQARADSVNVLRYLLAFALYPVSNEIDIGVFRSGKEKP
jgi:hypothetical protein